MTVPLVLNEYHISKLTMTLELVIIGRIFLAVVSIILIGLLIYVRVSNRSSNQFFVIMTIFCISVLGIAIFPNILNLILENSGFTNNAQVLLSISFIVIIYLLINQVKKGVSFNESVTSVIRKVAIKNFFNEVKIRKTELVIVIIAKNEAKTIGSIIDRINSLKLGMSYEILVVNDGSIDETEEIAKKKNVLLITHHMSLGIGGAVKTGYIACGFLNPSYVINLDADDQHDPSYIPDIISLLESGKDLVYGSRFSLRSDYKTNAVRFLGNKFYTSLVNRIGHILITDVTSGFRGIRADKIESMYFLAETNFAIELALRAARNNLKIGEVSIKSKMRQHGNSQFYKIERFFIYNINVCVQIYNAYFKKSNIPKYFEDMI